MKQKSENLVYYYKKDMRTVTSLKKKIKDVGITCRDYHLLFFTNRKKHRLYFRNSCKKCLFTFMV